MDKGRATMNRYGRVTRRVRAFVAALALIGACAAAAPEEPSWLPRTIRVMLSPLPATQTADPPTPELRAVFLTATGSEPARPASDAPSEPEAPEPGPLRRPVERPEPVLAPSLGRVLFGLPFRTAVDPPLGFTGRSSVSPSEGQQDPHFVPIEDRWRIGFPEWDRYGKGHPVLDEYPYMPGQWFDTFNQNVLKGDYPIIGQHTFLSMSASVLSFQEFRQVPTGTTPFESTARANEGNFFQRPDQFFSMNFFSLAFDLSHGDAAFKPSDWRIRLVPVFNFNNLSVQELGIVSPNVLQGTSRTRTFWALQEGFLERKLADTSTEYDFATIRVGSQPFNADFRGFLFVDINDAIRLFGTRNGNRDQYNLAYFRQRLKDTNSQLNTFKDRGQDLVFANYYRQDFIFPGYTTQVSFAFNHDTGPFGFNKNRFLVRPDPVGVVRRHEVDVAYLGWAGDGHVGRYNLTHQFYWALGHDSLNPLANRAQTINAQMFAIEGSYDRDWARFRASFFWASGDRNINNSTATGFDTILDAPVFAGGPFSYWNRQQVQLFGVNLKQRLSLVPDLRSDKFQSQANFVNPGLLLPTLGMDLDLTPRLRMLNSVNFLWHDQTNVLEQFLFQGHIHRFIGYDLSVGFDYRPLVSENASIVLGASVLIPGQGFHDLYDNANGPLPGLFSGFLAFTLAL